MFEKVTIIVFLSLFISAFAYSQRPAPNGTKVEVAADRGEEDSIIIDGIFNLSTKELILTWDSPISIYGLIFKEIYTNDTFIVPIDTQDNIIGVLNTIEIVLHLDTDVLLPNGDYDIFFLIDEETEYDSRWIEFHKQTE